MTRARRAAEARGRWAEWLAMAWLAAKGYRLLDHRARTAAGEIDLVACRGEWIAFVEVKARRTLEEALGAIGPRQRRRIERAAGCGSPGTTPASAGFFPATTWSWSRRAGCRCITGRLGCPTTERWGCSSECTRERPPPGPPLA